MDELKKCMDMHAGLPFWQESRIEDLAKPLLEESAEIKQAFN